MDTNSFKFISPWFYPNTPSLKRFMATVNLGDLLEFDRNDYKHWAVYVGPQNGISESFVVHLIAVNRAVACAYASIGSIPLPRPSAAKPKSGNKKQPEELNQTTAAAVRMETLESVLGKKSKVRVNNFKDQEWKPYDSQVVVNRALNKVCDNVDYFDIFDYNCEHFVNECRYGHNVSFQVDSTFEAINVALSAFQMYAAMASMISFKTRWFRLEDLDEIFSLVQDGDLLEFDRGNYSHWAVYVGIQEPCNEACIVHNASSLSMSNGMWGLTLASCHSVTSDSQQKKRHKRRRDGSFSSCSNVTVRLEKLIDVLGSDQVRINNSRDRLWCPYDSQAVKQRALNKVSEQITNYNALNYNCEHFVNECRYGRLVSLQMLAAVGIGVASTAIFGSALTAALAAKIAYTIFRRR